MISKASFYFFKNKESRLKMYIREAEGGEHSSGSE
jgi:hypothetical protein